MPRWLTQVRFGLRSLFHGERVEQELREEMRYHLERLIEEGLATVGTVRHRVGRATPRRTRRWLSGWRRRNGSGNRDDEHTRALA